MKTTRLVKKAQRGNDKAFLKLFQQYEMDIYRMAYIYTKHREDAYQSFKNITGISKKVTFYHIL